MSATVKVETLEVPGGRIAYEDAGTGPALVLLHEGIVDRRVWDREFPELARRHRVVRYDLRGYGDSTPATEPFSHVDDLDALVEELRIDHPVIIAPSMGGRIAIDYALSDPERMRGIFLLAPGLSGMQIEMDPDGKDAYDEDDRRSSAITAAWTAGQRSEAFEGLRQLWGAALTGPALDHFRTMVDDNAIEVFESRTAAFDRLNEPPAAPRLSQLSVPTQVLVGDRDNPSAPRFAMFIAKNVPGAGLSTIAGADHLINLSQPDAFDRELATFLEHHGLE